VWGDRENGRCRRPGKAKIIAIVDDIDEEQAGEVLGMGNRSCYVQANPDLLLPQHPQTLSLSP